MTDALSIPHAGDSRLTHHARELSEMAVDQQVSGDEWQSWMRTMSVPVCMRYVEWMAANE